MLNLPNYEFWLIVGSQHLYGPDAIQAVEEHARIMVERFNQNADFPYKIVFKSVATTPDAIRRLSLDANADDQCAGVIAWMHTFSPAKMWITGLSQLSKPLLHLHTQFNRDIPWDSIDMDFMNLNQSAHGDREFGHIASRLGIRRKVVVGHWEDPSVTQRMAGWMRTAVAAVAGRGLKIARFGDNMRQVAVTEGDKVQAQVQFGWSTDGFGVGDLVAYVNQVSETDVEQTVKEYREQYEISQKDISDDNFWDAVRVQARIELGLRAFLTEGGYSAFTTTFEDLHGLKQLPGLAVQRLMASGYGFGAEGDWKTAALVRIMKIIADNQGTSFMEDYTYHFEPGNEMVLGAHMLEVCPTIAASTPSLEVHPLSIGGKEDPARLVFDGRSGPALNASIIDLGHRFRLLVNTVEAIQPEVAMPKLPVARVLWKPEPSLATSAEAWILAGGAHHTCFSYHVTLEHLLDWAEMVDVEAVVIDADTSLHLFKERLLWNDIVRR